MRLRPTPTLLIPGLLLVPTLLSAQHGGQGNPPPPGIVEYGLPVPCPGTLTETAAGDFDGDGQQDVAFLSDNNLYILFAPGLYESTRAEGGGVTHLASAPRADAVDLLVITTFAGAQILEWTGSGFTRQDLGFPWVGASAIDAYTDPDGVVWIAGAQSTDYLCCNSYDFDQTTIFPTQSPESFRDVVLLEWEDAADTPDRPEVALMSDSAVLLQDALTGALDDFFYSSSFHTDAIARLVRPDEQLEWLACVSSQVANPTYQWFSTLSFDSTTTNAQLAGVNKQFYAITCGDTDTTDELGLEDVVLSGRSDWGLTWVPNHGTGSTPLFDFGESVSAVPGYTSPGGESSKMGRPEVLDVDGDGDDDVVMPIQQDCSLWVWREQSIQEDSLQPLLNPSFGERHRAFYLENKSVLRFELEAPWSSLPGAYLDIIPWAMPGAGQLLDASSFDPMRLDVSTISWPLTVEIQGVPYPHPDDESDILLDGLVFCLVQSVDAEGVNPTMYPPTRCYPGKIYGLHAAGRDPSPNRTYLEDMMQVAHLPLGLLDGRPEDPPPPQTLLGGSDPGGGGDINCLPPGPTSPPTRP